MLNEKLLNDLEALAERADKLETETSAAISHMDNEVTGARRMKEMQICAFLSDMQKILTTVQYSQWKGVTVWCCGDDWEGVPGGCGSHHRYLGVWISRKEVWFGRYFSGIQTVDHLVKYDEEHERLRPHDYEGEKAKEIREHVIDRWNHDAEREIERCVAAAAKAHVVERMKKATEDLHKANERYETYFGKDV